MHYTAKQPNMFPHPAVCPTFQELLKETTKQDKTKTQQLSSPHPLILVHPPHQIPPEPSWLLPVPTFTVFMTPVPSFQSKVDSGLNVLLS